MSMVIQAIYENGLFRPLGPVPELGERAPVTLTIRKPINREALRTFRGSLSSEEADEMSRLIQEGRPVEGARGRRT
jgi:predicted DNA-binding antitoxin AbrB/MazE fold protein